MFVFYESSGVYWFNGASTDNIREYNLVGILMGLAVYNAIILDIRFPFVCYKKLLTPAFMPEHQTNALKIKVGIIKPTLVDFRTIRPVRSVNSLNGKLLILFLFVIGYC
jgi:E3 ubiquitin-protein ligase HECTD2